MNDNNGYSAYIMYNVIIDVCWITMCSIIAYIIIMFTSHHVCWAILLMIFPLFIFGIKTKAQWGE